MVAGRFDPFEGIYLPEDSNGREPSFRMGASLHGVRRRARDAEERTLRLGELQQELRNALLNEGRPNSVVRLAEYLFSVPIITAARPEELLGVTRPTADAAIDALIEETS